MKISSPVANLAIERVLELSADAHIERRMSVKGSAAFQNLTGAIAAYGKALRVLVALREREELYALLAELEPQEAYSGLVH